MSKINPTNPHPLCRALIRARATQAALANTVAVTPGHVSQVLAGTACFSPAVAKRAIEFFEARGVKPPRLEELVFFWKEEK